MPTPCTPSMPMGARVLVSACSLLGVEGASDDDGVPINALPRSILHGEKRKRDKKTARTGIICE